ncbi:MAG: hypothetical protein WCS77_00085 [Elusimicrobiaceae bacterium]|jgi:hypothetical protein
MSGTKFFDYNYALQAFGGAVIASSNDTKKWYAFDGNKRTRWITSGEATDGDAVSIERDFQTNRVVRCLFVYDTNISDIAFYYWNGTAYVEFQDGVNCEIIKSTDYKHIYVEAAANITTAKIKITGSATLTANQEKYIGLFHSFKLLGALAYPIALNPTRNLEQVKHKLDNAKYFIIDKGEAAEFSLKIKSHINQADIDLLEALKERKAEFYIWPNGADESQFTYSFAPYRFKDLYKVCLVDKFSPEYTGNYYRAGLNDTLKMVEVD